MKHQALRPVAMMLSVLLVMAMPVRAGSIQFGDVVQTIVDGQNGRARVSLHLRHVTQNGRLSIAGGVASTSAARTQDGTQQPQQGGGSSSSGSTATGSDSSSTVAVEVAPAQGPTGQVQTVDLGDVTGTVCDCGEIPVVPGGRGFPLWPLLAGIPLICVTGICGSDDDRTPVCVVNCGGGETVIPEPATLLLFGSGLVALGARARRRRPRLNASGEETTAPAAEV